MLHPLKIPANRKIEKMSFHIVSNVCLSPPNVSQLHKSLNSEDSSEDSFPADSEPARNPRLQTLLGFKRLLAQHLLCESLQQTLDTF